MVLFGKSMGKVARRPCKKLKTYKRENVVQIMQLIEAQMEKAVYAIQGIQLTKVNKCKCLIYMREADLPSFISAILKKSSYRNPLNLELREVRGLVTMSKC